METIEQQVTTTEYRYPVTAEEYDSADTISTRQLLFESSPLEQTLSRIFPEPIEQTKADKARQFLGEIVKDMTDEELETLVAQCEYLINYWLDQYERQILGGKTLKEML